VSFATSCYGSSELTSPVTVRLELRCRWLRWTALAVRLTVGVLALGSGVLSGILAANTLGRESPLVWTVALLAGFAAGLLLMGNPVIHRLATRLDRAASDCGDAATAATTHGDPVAGHRPKGRQLTE
jgi:hypothetical protein